MMNKSMGREIHQAAFDMTQMKETDQRPMTRGGGCEIEWSQHISPNPINGCGKLKKTEVELALQVWTVTILKEGKSKQEELQREG